ncbi:hypothetical protein AAF712_012699 [Marasmius tenuissimus]|uniref:F-box domain-containing protein n=1 Tax=Marasmius tenuissimus TaxID=585030 RepID=A0ABR2ZHT4_9AGAR
MDQNTQPRYSDLLQASVDHAEFIEDLFGQRSFPSSPEIITRRFSHIEMDIKCLEAEIGKLKMTLHSLESHRYRLNRSIELGKSLMSPVRRLPSELLGHIFSLICADGSTLSSAPLKEGELPQNPALLSMICTSWREVALSLPEIWSKVSFEHFGRNCPIGKAGLLLMAELFVNRASTYPLTLSFSCWAERLQFPKDVDLVLETLCRCSGQWDTVYFDGCTSFYEHYAVRQVKGKLGSLRRLSVSPTTSLSDVEFIFEAPLPNLRMLDLVIDEMDKSILDGAHLEQLTELKLQIHPGERSPVEIASMCPNLRSFSFEYDIVLDIFETKDFGLHITSNLESLTVAMNPETGLRTAWAPFFDQTTLPTLSSLTIVSEYTSFPQIEMSDTEPLLECIARSGCPITYLSLKSRTLSNEQTHRLLRLIPGLETLRVWEENLVSFELPHRELKERTKEFLSLLVIDRNSINPDKTSSGPLLPRLKHLSVAFPSPDRGIDVLYEVARSRSIEDRKMGVDSLQSVEIEYRWDPPKGQGELPEHMQLEDLKERGLDISIRTMDIIHG